MEGVQVIAVIMSFSVAIVALIGGIMIKMDRENARREEGLSNDELAQKVARLEKTNAEYAQRLEDLEAIVVAQSATRSEDRPLRLAPAPYQVSSPAVEERNRQQVAELARRLGG